MITCEAKVQKRIQCKPYVTSNTLEDILSCSESIFTTSVYII